MKLGKYSIGVGDRFSHQGVAQLRAILKANETGLEISPVWNKSNREHIYSKVELSRLNSTIQKQNKRKQLLSS
jgi:hypothetical protein